AAPEPVLLPRLDEFEVPLRQVLAQEALDLPDLVEAGGAGGEHDTETRGGGGGEVYHPPHGQELAPLLRVRRGTALLVVPCQLLGGDGQGLARGAALGRALATALLLDRPVVSRFAPGGAPEQAHRQHERQEQTPAEVHRRDPTGKRRPSL